MDERISREAVQLELNLKNLREQIVKVGEEGEKRANQLNEKWNQSEDRLV